MSVSYNYVNLSAIGCLATVMQTREKCLCQLINYECIWSQASYPKINFLFAIKKDASRTGHWSLSCKSTTALFQQDTMKCSLVLTNASD